MASYWKRGNNKITARVTVPGSGGRRETKTFDTKREARRWAEGIEDGDAVPVAKKTLNDLADLYLRDETPKKGGARWERIRINRYRKEFPTLFSKPLADIQREDVEAIIDERLREVKASSVNRELNTLCSIFTHGRRLRWMTHNPVDTLRRPKDPPPRDRRISNDEIELILSALDFPFFFELEDESNQPPDLEVTEQRHKTAIAFLLAIETAMRQGEMCKIAWADVHLDTRHIFLPHTNTKTAKPRKIPLSTKAVRLINLLPKGEPHELMLGINPGVVSTMFRRARIKARIEDLTFHDSRHEACTRLAQILPTPFDLAKVSGHRDMNQILNTYYNRDASELAQYLP